MQLINGSMGYLGAVKRYTADSDLLAGRVVYRATGVDYSRSNAIVTARELAGVTLHGVSSGATVLVQRDGPVRVMVDSASVASIAYDCRLYLSSEAGGKVATAISGIVYPRFVGYCRSDAVDADGMVLCMLSINEHRDDSIEWELSRTVPTSNQVYIDVPVNLALFDCVRLVGENIDANASIGGTDIRLRVDGALATTGTYAGVLEYSAASGQSETMYVGRCGANDRFEFQCRESGGDKKAVYTCNYWNGGPANKFVAGVSAYPATSIGVYCEHVGGPTSGFVANKCSLSLFGKVRPYVQPS
jgi:hypothetical protein